MRNTKIEWSEMTWNPVTGCTGISSGCRNCYARRMAHRLAGRFDYPRDNPWRVTFHPYRIHEPKSIKKPKMIFVCSMGDLFHGAITERQLDIIFGMMAICPQHIFQVLTKRPYRYVEYFDLSRDNREESIGASARLLSHGGHSGLLELPLPNVWLGVSVENQITANERIPLLIETPAALRFISVEPMLAPVDLGEYFGTGNSDNPIDWVICGSETGPNARTTSIEWVRRLRDQCQEYNVPFFLKQLSLGGKTVKVPELDGMRWEEKPK